MRAIWPKGYQRGSLEKSYQKGDYLKSAMQESYSRTGFESAAFYCKLLIWTTSCHEFGQKKASFKICLQIYENRVEAIHMTLSDNVMTSLF